MFREDQIQFGSTQEMVVAASGRAFTQGNTVFLPSAPDPGNRVDVATLAHELTHVYQYQIFQATQGPARGAATYYAAGAVDQARYSLRGVLGNPYESGGLIETTAERVRSCFLGRGCAGSIFTPPGG